MNNKYKKKNGIEVRILCTDGPCSDYPVIGFLGRDIKVYLWAKNGRNLGYDQGSSIDLVEVKPKMKGWINVYSNGNIQNMSELHKSKEEADKNRINGCIACIEREFEEGEGL